MKKILKSRLSLAILFTIAISFPIISRADIAVIGDSIVKGYPYVEEGQQYVSLLKAKNFGIGGQTAEECLKRISEVTAVRPSKVIIAVGANDAFREVPIVKFKRTLRRMIKIVKIRKAILLTPPPYNQDHGYFTKAELNSQMFKYVKAIRAVGKSYDIPVVDIYKYFLILKNIFKIDGLYADSLHPNAKGHMYIYEYLKLVL